MALAFVVAGAPSALRVIIVPTTSSSSRLSGCGAYTQRLRRSPCRPAPPSGTWVGLPLVPAWRGRLSCLPSSKTVTPPSCCAAETPVGEGAADRPALLRKLQSERLRSLEGLAAADEEDKPFWREHIMTLNLEIAVFSKKPLTLRQLIVQLGYMRDDGLPPLPHDVFSGSPVARPTSRVDRTRVLRALITKIYGMSMDDRLHLFLSGASGMGKTQILADFWSAVLLLRSGARARPNEPSFGGSQLFLSGALYEFARNLEVFGVTFNNNTPFLAEEAALCARGGVYQDLPIYARIVWTELNNGLCSWQDFVSQMHARLDLDGRLPVGVERLDATGIKVEALDFLSQRRGNLGADGVLLVDELSRVCEYDPANVHPEDEHSALSSRLRSKICDLRSVGSKEKSMGVVFASLSGLFMQAENEKATVMKTSSGRTMVCAASLNRPTMTAVRAFFQNLRSIPGIKITAASPASAPADVDSVIDAMCFLSGGHLRSMQTMLFDLSERRGMQNEQLWPLLRESLRTMSMSSTHAEIVKTYVRSPLLCAVVFLSHPVRGADKDVVIPGDVIILPGGQQVQKPDVHLQWDALVRSTTIIDSAVDDILYRNPTALPSFISGAMSAHAAARSKLKELHREQQVSDPEAELEADSNPVLTALGGINEMFGAGTSAKGWELFHTTWELTSSVCRSYIRHAFPTEIPGMGQYGNPSRSFTLAERYPAAYGLCGSAQLLRMPLDNRHLLKGSRSFVSITQLLGHPADDLVGFLWVPESEVYPAVDAVIIHSRAGGESGSTLTHADLVIELLQFKTTESSGSQNTLPLTDKFVKPITMLPSLFPGHLWAEWESRVAFVCVANVLLSVDQGERHAVAAKVRRRVVCENGKNMTITSFLDNGGARSILCTRESLPRMYGQLFSGLMLSALDIVGAQVSTD